MKPANLFSWILQLAASAVLIMASTGKLTSRPESVAIFQQLDFDPGGRFLIGTLELIAALLLLVPQSIVWGAVLGWGIMTGALIAHCSRLGFQGDAGAGGLMAIAVWICCTMVIFLRRKQSLSLRRMFARDDDEGRSDAP
ncbi:DoxX family protein [Thalassoglobus polymorphus]|uniref:DoxX n=1 Tax=Thalassoglobus polymorphus TaxID=2527994 RepID=A0A517QJ69_9PLAN|nr:DoxX family protein [Thalassoglobus polymorphus]QDT31693.1 hypothetical protein Mal48_09280 [Thalassoglobus polymorphus]